MKNINKQKTKPSMLQAIKDINRIKVRVPSWQFRFLRLGILLRGKIQMGKRSHPCGGPEAHQTEGKRQAKLYSHALELCEQGRKWSNIQVRWAKGRVWQTLSQDFYLKNIMIQFLFLRKVTGYCEVNWLGKRGNERESRSKKTEGSFSGQLSSCSEDVGDSVAFRKKRIRTNARFLAKSKEPFTK